VNVEKRRGWEMGKDAPRGIENAWLWPFVWQVPSARTHARARWLHQLTHACTDALTRAALHTATRPCGDGVCA
jgi:hypothetical protein